MTLDGLTHAEIIVALQAAEDRHYRALSDLDTLRAFVRAFDAWKVDHDQRLRWEAVLAARAKVIL